MQAFIVVVDTPFFAVSKAGRASLPGLGAGRYTLHLWYSGMREEPAPQNVTLGENDHPSVSFVTR
jgi:hypothetical protein